MFKKDKIKFVFFSGMLSLAVTLVSCSESKYIPKDDKLYVGAVVHVVPDSGSMTKKKQKVIEKELLDLTRPRPNKKILGVRVKLWFYNISGKKEKGLGAFIRKSLGEPPVLFSAVDPKENEEILKNHLENKGYFFPEVFSKIKVFHDNKVKLIYTAKLGKPYRIKRVIFPEKDSSINKLIYATREDCYLQPGMQYNLDTLKRERDRIKTELKDKGLFYFSSTDLIFKVDSTAGDHQVDIYIQVKHITPKKAMEVYRLNNIYVFANHSLFQDSFRRKPDTAIVQGYIYIGNLYTYKPNVIVNSIFLQKGDIYSYSDYDVTLNRLMRLGTYKFVNIVFKDLDTTGKKGLLDTYIYLTPLPRKSIQVEVRALSRSDNFAGPVVTLSFKNRNIFGGAELLSLNGNGSFLADLNAGGKGEFSVTFGTDLTLDIPRFITPFFNINPPTRFVPRTEFKLGYQKFSEINLYNLNTFNFSAGYKWNESEEKTHELDPLDISFLKLGQTSKTFDSLENRFVSLKRSFATQFVIGSYYAYTYNTQVMPVKRFDTYFRGTVDAAGNLLGQVQSAINGHKPDVENPNTIFNIPYSQYILGSADLHEYWNIHGRDERLVARVFTGIGIPYGNSEALPYIKEFFSGGNNSVRAFLPGFLGPGSYQLPENNKTIFIDQVGDIKLEGNLEYRFPIIGILKGALFMDAGNIWLKNEDTSRPGGKFDINTFYKQIAVGTGFGLRIDASYFVLRFDVAMPLRKAYPTDGDYWVIDKMKPSDSKWRANNIILNIGIGYPF